MEFFVYVIGLKKEVTSNKRFMLKNPDYIKGKPCVYVGSSSKLPEIRAEEHRTAKRNKRGKLYNKFAHEYYDGLRPSKYKKLNPISSRKIAEKTEFELANRLRKRGYAVWCN